MKVTVGAVENIPRSNLDVSRDDFAALWLSKDVGVSQRADWYVSGVAATCSGLACAVPP